MSGKSNIEWTEHTWNPIVGCSIVSPGCTNCYAMRDAWRKNFNPNVPHYKGLTKKVNGNAVWTGKLAVAPDSIFLEPLRRKEPTTYFVNSMGDLFHEDARDEDIDRVFAVMALCPQHTFQVLTKRAERMRAYMCSPDRKRTIAECTMEISNRLARDAGTWKARPSLDHFSACFAGSGPFRNVWLGVSAERQQEADERIPHLLQTPAAVRFISAEPLLGHIDLSQLGVPTVHHHPDNRMDSADARRAFGALTKAAAAALGGVTLDWIIVGGESGKNARPMNPQWARDLRDQCNAAGVAFFFKQWGEHVSVSEVEGEGLHHTFPDGRTVRRVGKKAAGRLLDGVEHNGMPEIAA